MDTYQIICLCGIPTIIAAIIAYLIGKLGTLTKWVKALKSGVQALLRDRLLQMDDHYQEKGYAPIYAKENFENMYKNYHSLGQNGVMDGKYEEFQKLPDKPRTKTN